MPVEILDLPKQFRPKTSITYPPFKCGRYMEEYFYDYILENKDKITIDRIYIPIFWTNIQNHPGFKSYKRNYDILLQTALSKYPQTAKFFTVVQHDDGPMINILRDILIFGACTGDIPLPLIYEDTKNTLLNISQSNYNYIHSLHLASFIGSKTHNIREIIYKELQLNSDIFLTIQNTWNSDVSKSASDLFIDKTLASKFCLAPRGYGRSSFRFFEAMLLDRIPVYFWDDKEWLPYMEHLDYSKFAISIHISNIHKTYEILKNISDEQYLSMLNELHHVRHWFTLEGMSEYIISKMY